MNLLDHKIYKSKKFIIDLKDSQYLTYLNIDYIDGNQLIRIEKLNLPKND